jgi:nucleoside-diphosphate-sugar epimerase
MRVFVTGASGWIGSAVVPELIRAGHEVTGLARSDASAAALTAAGAQVQPGTIDDLDIVRSAAAPQTASSTSRSNTTSRSRAASRPRLTRTAARSRRSARR